MITINFSATVGLGLRHRVIMPALVLQDRPVLIVPPTGRPRVRIVFDGKKDG